MSAVNLKFIHANILRAGELHIPVNVLFGGNLAKTIESWEPTLRMEGIASVIALFNIISTTLQFSSVCRTADGRFHVPLNLFNMVIARSSYGKSDITNLVRHVLQVVDSAVGNLGDAYLDEFTRAGLMNSLDKSTKIFLTDEADISLVDCGLFSGFVKPSPEANCRSLAMILYDRMHSSYVRRLSNKSVVVEKSKLNILGMSTGELVGMVVSRMKAGGSWDPIIGRFSWWVLDGPPIMESLTETTLESSIPSIEQLVLACSVFNNCIFKYESNALRRVVEWSNDMKLKSYHCRHDAYLSALIGKSVQHMHRYAGLLQTIEYGFQICSTYVDRFEAFPLCGSINQSFIDQCRIIFIEIFGENIDDQQSRSFFITDAVVMRSIDLVSGLLQQTKILMDDSQAPAWNGYQTRPIVVLPLTNEKTVMVNETKKCKKKKHVEYINNEKSQRIAVEILLFPSICFTLTQLHRNTFLHNVSRMEKLSVLKYLTKSELIEHIKGGIKTTRRSTSVYVKRMPLCDDNGQIDDDYKLIFEEKFKEFNADSPKLTIQEYLKKSSNINLNAIGKATNHLLTYFSLPEYTNIDLTPLYHLKETGNAQSATVNKCGVNIDEAIMNNPLNDENRNFHDNSPASIDSIGLFTVNDSDGISSIFDSLIDNNDQIKESSNIVANCEVEKGIVDCDGWEKVGGYIEVFSDANVQHIEEIGSNNSHSSSAIMIDPRKNGADRSESKIVHKKKKNINDNNAPCNSNNATGFTFSSPPSSRLRSRKRHYDASAFQCPSTKKKKTGRKK